MVWHSRQADRIGPHITLVHELDESANVRRELEDVAGATPRFHVWLGKTIRWGPPEDGIAIDVVDHEGGLGQLLTELHGRGFRTTGRAHVTLVHGRALESQDLDGAWESLKNQDLRLRQTVERLAVIEQREQRWVHSYECQLERGVK